MPLAGSACFSRDESHVAFLGPRGEGAIFDLRERREVARIPPLPEVHGGGFDDLLRWSSAQVLDGLELWAIDVGRRLRRLRDGRWELDEALANLEAFVRVGDEIAAVCKHERFELVRGDLACELPLGSDDPFAIAAHGDDVLLAYVDGNELVRTRYDRDLAERSTTRVALTTTAPRGVFLHEDRLFVLGIDLARPDARAGSEDSLAEQTWRLEECAETGDVVQAWSLPPTCWARWVESRHWSLGVGQSVWLPFSSPDGDRANLLELSAAGATAQISCDRFRHDPGGVVSPCGTWFAVLGAVPHLVRPPSPDRVLELDPLHRRAEHLRAAASRPWDARTSAALGAAWSVVDPEERAAAVQRVCAGSSHPVLAALGRASALDSNDTLAEEDRAAVCAGFIGLERAGLYVDVCGARLNGYAPNTSRFPDLACYDAHRDELARLGGLEYRRDRLGYCSSAFPAHVAALADADLPLLRSLSFDDVTLPADGLARLADAPWACTLTELYIHVDQVDVAALARGFPALHELSILIENEEQLQALLGATWPALEILRLHAYRCGDAAARALAGWPPARLAVELYAIGVGEQERAVLLQRFPQAHVWCARDD